jgi:hypothetical protein
VVDQAGKPLGFFVAVVRAGAAATVVQMAATRSGQEATLASLVAEAASSGCVEVTGRVQPEQVPWVAASPAMLTLAGARFIAVARKPGLVDTIRSGRAWITRLEGEYPMGF